MSGLSLDDVLERLEELEPKPAVVNHGRTFRKCSKCGRMGWHPQASAEICCGAAMVLIEQPAMTVPDYVEFAGFPNTYASGKISKAEVLDMMKRDLIQPLPDTEKDRSSDFVTSQLEKVNSRKELRS